ncbi:UNVERIFIED_CONTAM: hypothetical protein NCL1_19763 [Trichonephila clavipes]
MDIEPINITEESPLEVTPLLARRRSTVSASSTDTTSITRSTAGQSVEEKPEFRFLDEEASDVAGISTSYQMLTVPETAEQAPEQNVTEQTSLITQAIIHTLVAVWPLTLAILGLACFLDCPANPLLPLMIFMVGFLGSVTVVLRLIRSMWMHLLDADLALRLQSNLISLELLFLTQLHALHS